MSSGSGRTSGPIGRGAHTEDESQERRTDQDNLRRVGRMSGAMVGALKANQVHEGRFPMFIRTLRKDCTRENPEGPLGNEERS